ncbi:Dethiobiotin synthetase [Bathymodiolus heckerae thiotrophic gill symbiont]|uniref:dethiobiotin synthase n=1 Tax=Bathymodiolus heckerae thiotrophic gill symbiont TaxID=1052212 RepID=UPI0010B26EED|nr:dethiobiotin synthase [Bathymodiolus heckerae thiotrophic gill symbiont]SMN13153.1 Dethiobiotin synthetase [Bathymodiolus heckerae thiotrophic gill symbiont]
MKGLFISGSGTDVGKTFVARCIILALNEKYRVVARKPIESDCIKVANGLMPKDAVLLNNACVNPEPIDSVCRFKFEDCVSGEKASLDKGVDVNLQNLIGAVQPANSDDFMIIEGAGGLYSPIAEQVLNSDFALALGLPIVIVVKDELGAINQALLSIDAAKTHKLNVVMLVLNRIIPNDLNNAQALNAYTDVAIVTFSEDKLNDFNAKVLALI